MPLAAEIGAAIAVLLAILGIAAAHLWHRSLSRRLVLLRQALDASPDARLVLAPDDAVAYANSAFDKLFAGDAAQPVARIEGALADPEGARDFARLRAHAAVSRGTAVVQLRDRPGAGAGWFKIEVNPIAGRPGYALWTIEDVTARRDMAAAMREERDRFAEFLANAPIGLARVDRAGRVLEANRALGELLGAAPSALIGRELTRLVHPDYRAGIAANLAATLEAAEAAHPPPIELRLEGPRETTSLVFASRLDGGVLLRFIDVTAQKKLETQGAQSQKMQAIGQLAGVAHDFNNLLTAMIGFSDLLLMRFGPGDPAFADIMQIKHNANRAARLVRQLLAFSRQQTLAPRIIDIADVLDELSDLLRRLIGERVELRLEHGRDLGLARVDQGQLEQVLINLAVNARDAMPEGGTLTIRAARMMQQAALSRGAEIMPEGDYIRIEVVDTGTGITPENLARIFDPFFSTKEVGSGTGLGLSTVYGIVKQTGGFIFVDSAPGRGTAFEIYLPRHRGGDMLPDDNAASAGQPPMQDGASERPPDLPRDLTGTGTIMLVEDEDPVRIFAARALRNKGYNVVEAKSAEAALELMRGGRDIDLLVTDVVMPQIDGPALVRDLRERHPGLKVVFISGYAEDAIRQRIERGGGDHFLSKPFSLNELAAKVQEVLGGPAA
jgi:two-component system cell cycle sensor histidine kinase/response regulator CckA